MIPSDHSWIQPLIGLPWASGARGPKEFDCWGLLWYIYTNIFGIKIPEYPIIDSFNLALVTKEMESARRGSDWTLLKKPEHGCAVGMSSNILIHHVGMWLDIDGGLILHASDKRYVVADSLRTIRAKGISRILFYKLNERS